MGSEGVRDRLYLGLTSQALPGFPAKITLREDSELFLQPEGWFPESHQWTFQTFKKTNSFSLLTL